MSALCQEKPHIAEFFTDPEFQETWRACLESPETFPILIHTDPRYMIIFKEVTDIDLLAIVEEKWAKEEAK